ncbi:MAG TPA: NmrA family NAD(P)-binding protein, partial [Chryseolinea sp.]|nr:NmrA family NAD(P)-binding protein [Chryseolinea sp.]
ADDGNWHIALPQGDTKLAGVSVEDIGSVVSEIFKAPEEFKGRVIGVVGEDFTLKQYVDVMTEILKRPYVYDYVPYQTYATFAFPGASELANMFEFNRLYISDRKADLDLTKKLSPAVRTFSEWLSGNKHHFHNLAECQQAIV